MRVIGIDPGLSGALAVVVGKPKQAIKVEGMHDLPTVAETTSSGKTRRRIDPVKLRDLLIDIGPVDKIIVERLVAPPGISAMSGYSMGATAATIATVLRLLELDFQLVSANVWKRGLDLPSDKEAARQWACRYFEDDRWWKRKMDHNRAEAACLGVWGVLAK